MATITTSATTTSSLWNDVLNSIAEAKPNTEVKDKSKNHFSGFFKKGLTKDNYYITSVIYSDPATIVFWNDGTKTVCKCSENDTYSPEAGLTMCVLKKLIGASSVREMFSDWVVYGDGTVTVKDVRKKHKDE